MPSGLLWAIAIVFEIVLFAAAHCVVARLGATNLILLGAAASVLRWSGMGLDPSLPVLLPLQVLPGLSFAATHLGAMHFIARTTGDRAGGTAQALNAAATSGVFMAAVCRLGGTRLLGDGGLCGRGSRCRPPVFQIG